MYKRFLLLFWAALAIGVILFITQPIGLGAQAYYGLCAIFLMLLIHLMKLKGIARHLFIIAGCSVALRYLYWRTTSTLPDADDLLSFIPGLLLLLAEIYSVGMLFLSAVIAADPVRRKPVALSGPEAEYPTVDVMIPSYNEDDDILFTTLAAAKNLDYPASRFNVYLLDDGGTDQKCQSEKEEERQAALDRRERLQAFCDDLGIHYLTRARNVMAKAGNLNNGMENSDGEFIVVLDADHAPVREFLKRTIGHLQQNDTLFLVQTPHFFMNADPVEKNLELFNIMPSENEMFYSITQKGLDKWDGSFFCGSAAILRRTALNEVGGFKGMSITEDCETALELHSRGWSSAYVDEPMIAGFQPETVSSFLTQRSRWCQGMLQILILKPPFLKKGLRPMQRIAYMSSMMFWLFPMSRLAFIFSPPLYIFFDLEIYNASFQEFLVYTGMFMFMSALMQNYLFGSVRWPWVSEAYEYLQSITLTKTIVSTIMNPKKPIFKVTDKGNSLDNDFFSEHGWQFLFAHLFLIATLGYGLYRMHAEAYSNELLLVVTLWATFNVILSGIVFGVCAERRERRRHYRMSSTHHGLVGQLCVGGEEVPVLIKDIAIGGIRIELQKDAALGTVDPGTSASLTLLRQDTSDEVHTLPVSVRWIKSLSEGQSVGLDFQGATAKDRRFIAFLMLPNNFSIQDIRVQRKNYRSILTGSLAVIRWSLTETVRGFKSALSTYFDKPKSDTQQA